MVIPNTGGFGDSLLCYCCTDCVLRCCRRADNGDRFQVRGATLDNRWIVPYNEYLSLRFDTHINVEVCNTVSAVKYVYMKCSCEVGDIMRGLLVVF